MPRSPRPIRLVPVVLLLMFATACEFSDMLAFDNTTDFPITVVAELDGEFSYANCDDASTPPVSFDGEVSVLVPARNRLCLIGPQTTIDDMYDARDRVISVEVLVDGTPCLEGDGEQLHEQFVDEGGMKVLTINGGTCPGIAAIVDATLNDANTTNDDVDSQADQPTQ